MNIEGKQKQSNKVKILLAIISLSLFTLVFQSFFVGFLVFLGIFLHERGHLKAAEYIGVPHKGMYFLPGLGAVALLEEFPKSRSQECFIAIAGPAAGMAYTCVLAGISGIVPWAAAASIIGKAALWNGVINLLNLLCPVDPLDGGRILKSITFSLHPIIFDVDFIDINCRVFGLERVFYILFNRIRCYRRTI
jgi:Zn-dependent protease